MNPRLSEADRLVDMQARVCLLHLSGMGPARIRWLLSRHEPVEVVARLRAGEYPAPLEEAPPGIKEQHFKEWKSEIARLDVERLLPEQFERGWTIIHPEDAAWPFVDEPEPPLLLFCAGDLGLLNTRPAVAVVGTRRCTSVGRNVAHRMALDLADAGVTVISGLALGIDAAAHRGALDGGGAVIGVVGTGLDVVYPIRNKALWHEVMSSGLLISECPAGIGPARWRFPARNRLIASLADASVIVESHGRGGALLTAEESAERGKAVLSVPGSVLSPAADGTNSLIVEGAIPARDAADVLVALGWSASDRPTGYPELPLQNPSDDPAQASLVPDVAEVIRREVRAGAISVESLSVLTGRSPMSVLSAVHALVEAGEVELAGSVVIWRDL